MTKDEKRIAAAQERVKKSTAALQAVWHAQNEAERKARERFSERKMEAEKRVRDATAELSTAELAAHLIEVGKTIVRIKGVFAVPVLTRPGYVNWLPVTKDNRVHRARAAFHHSRLDHVIVTNRRLAEDGK